MGDESAQHHGNAVEGVVLRSEGRRRFWAVPVKGRGHDGFGKVRVGQPVRPLPLPLETRRHGVFAQRFLVPAQLVQLGIPIQNVLDDDRHLGDELPVLIGRDNLGAGHDLDQFLARVAVEALGAVLLDPRKGLFVFLGVVDAQRHAAENLHLVHPFGPNAEVALEHVGVAVGTHNAHGDRADVDIGFVLHPAGGDGAAGKPQNLFFHVGGNGGVTHVLHVMAVDGEGGQSLLGIGGQHCRQIYRAGALGAVEAPDGLDGEGVHVEGLHAVAPAGGHGQGGGHILGGEIFLAASRFRAAADGAGRNDDLHGCAVRVLQCFNESFSGVGHAHGLGFQTFADTAPTTVDDGTNANFRVHHVSFPPCIRNISCSRGAAR